MQIYEARRRQDFAAAEKISETERASDALARAIPSVNASARRVDLPSAMRDKMENAFGMDFSGVRLYENQSVADAGANAMAQGDRISFAPGKLDFYSRAGQELLGHELSHIASQARGESRGSGLVMNDALEARADREGAMAAAGETVHAAEGAAPALAPAQSAPAQADRDDDSPGLLKRAKAATYLQAIRGKNNFKRNWFKYTAGTYGLGSDVDSLLTSGYVDRQGNQHGSLVKIDSKANRYKNGAKGAVSAGLGLIGVAQNSIGSVKNYHMGDYASGTANAIDALASLGDTGAGVATSIDQFRNLNNKKIKKGTAITGIASSGLKSISGLISGFSGWSSQSSLEKKGGDSDNLRYAVNEADDPEMKRAFRQAARNARANKFSGFTKSLGFGLKSAGTALNTFLPGIGGFLGGKGLSIAGDAVNLFNTWNTDRMKRNARKDTLNEAFGNFENNINTSVNDALTHEDGDKSMKQRRAEAKDRAIRAMLNNDTNNIFDENTRNLLLQKQNLKRKDVYAALSNKRANLITQAANAGGNTYKDRVREAIGDMGIHTSEYGSDATKNGVLKKLMA
ncbi:MAG: DUF4157 domain-containing protein [Oscillospiraceae bacterium]|nr:DUF4157 domain-containing protein [Oscillospiraceae bacterium]